MVESKLDFFKRNVPRTLLILGVIGVVISLLAPNPYGRGLFLLVSLVPIIVGLLTYVRLGKAQNDDGKVSKSIIEASWILFTFGVAYLVMATSTYYHPGNDVVHAALIVLGIVQAIFGAYSLVSYGREGYIMTP